MTFNEFLRKVGGVTIHHRNNQNVSIEMFKAKNNLLLTTVKEIFPDRNYNGSHLHSQVDFEVPPVKCQWPGYLKIFRTYNLGNDP